MLETDIWDYYILFPNHHEGLRAHKELKAAGVRCTISPTPREVSTSCGISLLVAEKNLKATREVIEKYNIKIDGIKRIQRKRNNEYRSC